MPKQLAVGVGAGWFTGYMTMKLGKMAATAIGKILNSSRSLPVVFSCVKNHLVPFCVHSFIVEIPAIPNCLISHVRKYPI